MLLHPSSDPMGSVTLASQRRMERQLPDWLDGGQAVLHGSGAVLEANVALAEWLDRPAEQLRGEQLAVVLAHYHKAWGAALGRLMQTGGSFAQALWEKPGSQGRPAHWFRAELTRCNGGLVFRLNSAAPPLPEVQELGCERCFNEGRQGRELFFRWARAEEQRNQLMQRWPGIVFSQRPDGSFYFVSPQMEQLTGVRVKDWEEGLGRFWDVIHEADRPGLQQHVEQLTRAETPAAATFRVRHLHSGKIAYVVEHRQAVRTQQGILLGYEGVWLDLTHQRLVEERLSAATWKETLSALTAGMAHDFRNVMAGMLGLAEAFQAQLDAKHPLQPGLALMRDSAWQAAQSVQRILELYRGKIGEKSYQDLNQLAREMSDLARTLFARRLQVSLELAPGQLPVYVDAFELRQAFLNLALNALDAMPAGGGLTIATSRHDTLASESFARGIVSRLPAVCLAVSDTGCGIASEHLPLIFEPFFTTKSLDKGSGLGLYNVWLFLEKHGGSVSVETGKAKGTTFRLWLPESDFSEMPTQGGAGGSGAACPP